MKVIILAGGFGTRLGSITEVIPKPMVRIGDRPILWHIMKRYSCFGYKDFVLSLGYKSEVIKDYFLRYQEYSADVRVSLGSGHAQVLSANAEADWTVTLAYTGLHALKGARVKRIEQYLDEENMLTYGDGVADIDIDALVSFHRAHGRVITITGVYPPARFGEIVEKGGRLISFEEKPQASAGLINGGFMVFNKRLLSYLSGDDQCDLEIRAFPRLAADNQIAVYRHLGKWECVDNERDLAHLNRLWDEGKAFWKKW
jgi:glucose-1-phosphate cytidylyltransferase